VRTKHTPTPWFWMDGGEEEECEPPEPGKKWLSIINSDGDEIAIIVNRKTEPTRQQIANAKFIEKACNSHELLLTAAKEAKNKLLRGGNPADTIGRLRDAINRAENGVKQDEEEVEADEDLSCKISDLLWYYLKKDRENKDRVQTNWGTKTQLGLAACVLRIVTDWQKTK